MTVSDLQIQVDEWIRSVGSTYFPPTTNLCMLAEEVGELSRLISRQYGEQQFKSGEKPDSVNNMIADELADILFVAVCIANDLDIDLTEAIANNFDKKNARDRDRYRRSSTAAIESIF